MDQRSARVVEVHAAAAQRCVIERFPKRFEIGKAPRQRIGRRSRTARRQIRPKILLALAHPNRPGMVIAVMRSTVRARATGRLCDGKRVWHKHGVNRQRRPRPPLDRRRLEELALRYVGRFATSRKRLADYLERKLKERGWEGEGRAPVGEIVERLAALGYVDDAAFALARARSMGTRGYGSRRLAGALAAAGIAEADAEPAMEHSAEESGEAILRSTVTGDAWGAQVEAGGEGAFNFLDAHSSLIVGGAPVILPSANVRIEEKRGEGFVTATVKRGPLSVESGGQVLIVCTVFSPVAETSSATIAAEIPWPPRLGLTPSGTRVFPRGMKSITASRPPGFSDSIRLLSNGLPATASSMALRYTWAVRAT